MTLTAPPDETPASWTRGEFTVSCDRDRLTERGLDAVHRWLSDESYWAKNVSRAVVERSIAHSLPFAVYHDLTGKLVGFCRVISDRTTFAYLADVFVLAPWRGQGLSKLLLECVQAHPDLQGLRRWVLVTSDAHGLYEQFGFRAPEKPETYMERRLPSGYNQAVTRNEEEQP